MSQRTEKSFRSWLGIAGLSVLTLGLVDCGARAHWTKTGMTAQEWQRDTYECERDLRQSGYFGNVFEAPGRMQQFYGRCLQAKGYRLVTNSRSQAGQQASEDPRWFGCFQSTNSDSEFDACMHQPVESRAGAVSQ